ncbi:unnamed protein product [Calypogeia fissa]
MSTPEGEPQSSAPQSGTPPPPSVETEKSNVIRSDLSLTKATLRLEKDEENPGFHLVAFSFHGTLDGCVSIFLLSKETESCSYTPGKPHLCTAKRFPIKKGLHQTFQQPSGSGTNLALFDDTQLAGAEELMWPLVVRLESLGKDPPADFSLNDELPIGAPVPRWVNCQATHAVIEKKEDWAYKVRVVRQTLWFEGKYFELQDILGIDNNVEGNDAEKGCVICKSRPRDVVLLPCRHMCLCSECAEVSTFKTNRLCPICQTPVERLLQIITPKKDTDDRGAGMDSHGASASQSSSQPTVV